MHEEALFRDLRRKLEQIAREEHATEISRVEVWVGALSHVSEATLRARWPMTTEGTVARSSRLDVRLSSDVDDPRASGIVLTEVDLVDPDLSLPPEPSAPPSPFEAKVHRLSEP